MTRSFDFATGSQQSSMKFPRLTSAFALFCYATNVVAINTPPHSSLARAIPALERRQNTCPAEAPVSCSAIDPKIPGSLCCPKDTTCMSIDSSSTAMCCPAGKDCENIQIISCDVKLQDPGRSRPGPLFTSRLNDTLPTCGNACCPFGFVCEERADKSNYCRLDSSKAITTAASPLSTTTTPTPTQSTSTASAAPSAPTTTRSSTPSVRASGIDSTSPTPERSSNPFPPGVFLAGFFPGILIGALGVLAWVILTGRHRKQQPMNSRSSSPYKPEMASAYETQVNSNGNIARRTKNFGKSMFQKKNAIGTPGLPFDSADGWKNLTPPNNSNIPVPGPRVPAGPGARHPSDASSHPRGPPAGAETSRFAQSTMQPTGPVTPLRNGRPDQNGSPEGEVIRIYSPPTVPTSAVAPLRGMNTQRRSRDSDMGPPNGYGNGPRIYDSYGNFNGPKSGYGPRESEVLTPARYDAAGAQPRIPREMGGQRPERPETTFTDMLRQIHFPDPLREGNAPAMPAIPKEFRN